MAIKAVLFDLDGVLVDTCELHYLSFNKALVTHGRDPVAREYHDKHLNGIPTTLKLTKLGYSSDEAAKVNITKQQFTQEALKDVYLAEDKLDIFTKLKLIGVKIGVVTNACKETAMTILSNGLEQIDIVITNEDVTKPKPDPMAYNKAMRILGVRPDEVIIVEDSPVGYEAAIAAKAQCVIRVRKSKDVYFGIFEGLI
jgi:beta-phosphoglucomutase